MSKIFIAILLFSFTISVLSQSQPDNSAAAKAFVEALVKKDFGAAYEYFGKEIKAQLPISELPTLWDSITKQVGDFKSQGKIIKAKSSKGEKISTICEFEKASVAISTVFDTDGKIQGFFFEDPQKLDQIQAKYESPSYANAKLFTEKDVSVGKSDWILPATLTMPVSKQKVPAIVLVHGSGPNDRDETHINPANKVFKDLAWGLASRGIAVLRYDKRTLVYGAKLATSKNGLTVNEETVDDAVAAVDLLRGVEGIDTKNIYVLGHSLGGMMIPRIGLNDPQIAGLIIFAGTSRPLEDVIVEQHNYLASLDGTLSSEEQSQLNAIKLLAEKTKGLKATTPSDTKTLFDLPVSYWADLNSYKPAIEAQKLKQPILILQGEKDYQVTLKDFQVWKNALDKRKNVRFKTYSNLTHLFMESPGGVPSPKDYDAANHVSETVIADIVSWTLEMWKNNR